MNRRHAIIWAFFITLIPLNAWGDAGRIRYPAIEGRVVKVLSGDSILLETGQRVEQVHYIGVRTPRMEERGEGALDYTRRSFLLNTELVGGKIIHLEFDIMQRDPAGRLLAHVFLLNKTFVNAELLLYGYGVAVYTPPNGMYRRLFARLEHQARSVGRGMWRVPNNTPLPRDGFRGPYVANRKYKIFHRPHCPWIQGIPAPESARFQSRKDALSQGYLPCQHCKP
ncbi:MAG: thermonuclease family protein [Deltaproteobacteria bacterium]|nr:thermonuclease family protein [Deltaproteobacteria bacterium]MBW2305452.1 thermonuclease family protein [Deltaproteobacteria bacterium]